MDKKLIALIQIFFVIGAIAVIIMTFFPQTKIQLFSVFGGESPIVYEAKVIKEDNEHIYDMTSYKIGDNVIQVSAPKFICSWQSDVLSYPQGGQNCWKVSVSANGKTSEMQINNEIDIGKGFKLKLISMTAQQKDGIYQKPWHWSALFNIEVPEVELQSSISDLTVTPQLNQDTNVDIEMTNLLFNNMGGQVEVMFTNKILLRQSSEIERRNVLLGKNKFQFKLPTDFMGDVEVQARPGLLVPDFSIGMTRSAIPRIGELCYSGGVDYICIGNRVLVEQEIIKKTFTINADVENLKSFDCTVNQCKEGLTCQKVNYQGQDYNICGKEGQTFTQGKIAGFGYGIWTIIAVILAFGVYFFSKTKRRKQK